jgi:predicted metal-dependent peptidase
MRAREFIILKEDSVGFESRCQAVLLKISSLATPEEQAVISTITIEAANDPNQVDKMYARVKSRKIYVDEEEFTGAPISVLIFLIAHEAAHIILAHQGDIPAAQSQQQELAADAWASQIITKIGISKVPVFTWLGRRKNELERRLKLERDPSNADFFKNQSHPTTDQRMQQGKELGVELSKANTDQIDQLLKHMA